MGKILDLIGVAAVSFLKVLFSTVMFFLFIEGRFGLIIVIAVILFACGVIGEYVRDQENENDEGCNEERA